MTDEELEDLLDKKEELESVAQEINFKIKESDKNLTKSKLAVKKEFGTINPTKLKKKQKELISSIAKQMKILEDNELYQEYVN